MAKSEDLSAWQILMAFIIALSLASCSTPASRSEVPTAWTWTMETNPPGATVEIDGQPWRAQNCPPSGCVTPLKDIRLPPDTHTVTFTRDGYLSDERKISGFGGTLHVTMVPVPDRNPRWMIHLPVFLSGDTVSTDHGTQFGMGLGMQYEFVKRLALDLGVRLNFTGKTTNPALPDTHVDTVIALVGLPIYFIEHETEAHNWSKAYLEPEVIVANTSYVQNCGDPDVDPCTPVGNAITQYGEGLKIGYQFLGRPKKHISGMKDSYVGLGVFGELARYFYTSDGSGLSKAFTGGFESLIAF